MTKSFDVVTYVEDDDSGDWVAECGNLVGVGDTEQEAFRRLLLAMAALCAADFDGFVRSFKADARLERFIAPHLQVCSVGQFARMTVRPDQPCYGEHIEGIVGGDCGLVRDVATDEIVGIKLRLHELNQSPSEGE